MSDLYCDRCDVFGHAEDTDECLHYWKTTEEPFRERMQRQVGKIFKLKEPTPILCKEWQSESGWYSERMEPTPGTMVRLVHYTPDRPGMKAGNYWTIETLDGEFSATQIYQDELEELSALDKLSLIEKPE